jgi:hypothetical protein
MSGTLRQNPLSALNQAARDPLDALAALKDNFHSRIESTNTIGYIADPDWESAVQRRLGMSSESVGECFWPLWFTVVETLRAQGMAVGPFSFYEWNDGDAGLVRAMWCLIRHLRPVNVVETYLSGGVIVVDDIDVNPAFDTFTRAHTEHPSFVYTAEPLRPDRRRFNQKGLFGIICKQSPQDADPE